MDLDHKKLHMIMLMLSCMKKKRKTVYIFIRGWESIFLHEYVNFMPRHRSSLLRWCTYMFFFIFSSFFDIKEGKRKEPRLISSETHQPLFAFNNYLFIYILFHFIFFSHPVLSCMMPLAGCM